MTAQDQQSRAELLPCAHCGSSRAAISNQDPDHLSGGYYIECQDCGASTGLRFACGEDPKPLLVEQWNRRALPAPENVRDGDPYDDPAFEDLARTMGVWGTAQSALCAQFFLAGRGALPAGIEPAASVYTMEALVPGGREVAHVSLRQSLPAGTMLFTAAQVLAMGRVPPGCIAVERNILEDASESLGNFISDHGWGDADMAAADNLSTVLATTPRPPAAQEGA